MKKPNITEGEWEIAETSGNEFKFGIRSDKGYICFMVDGKSFEAWNNYMSDAKAISAVPEMIDALIDARQSITKLGEFEGGREKYLSSVQKIDKALKKAGCKSE